ncbi:hypothetical protein [Leptolyngbya sp. FACHB-261]|uniref:hypothetical protein n=1 Tax=Leptolyngbya sp. FACHB-261 TaxID=2692806 RepID=UPI0016853D87|nr:hypothetical protein [Leptolyngbya sp. FACHB-261]MBD2101523.1 hypothetical protein [Leptolyngbya sp. FACHB-261]
MNSLSDPTYSTSALERLIEQILASGKISRADQHKLMSNLLNKLMLSETEQQKVNRIFERLRAGRLKVVD